MYALTTLANLTSKFISIFLSSVPYLAMVSIKTGLSGARKIFVCHFNHSYCIYIVVYYCGFYLSVLR